MDPKHRKIITDNMVHLVEKTNDVGLEMLIDFLVRDGVFTEDMAKKYKDPRDSMRKLNFFNDIQTRGPLAFNKFINALIEAERNDLVSLLKPNNAPTRTNTASRATSSGSQILSFPSYYLEADPNLVRNLETLAVQHPNAMVNLNTQPLVVRVKPAVERLDKKSAASAYIPHYPMGSRPKGLALIINIFKFQGNVHKEREGAYIDTDNMYQLFEQLGYQTEKHENLTRAEFLEILRTFTGREEHTRVSSCMVAIMSHGSMIGQSVTNHNTVIYTADGLAISYMDIVDKFNSENCPGLVHKPKVFFFQACRGAERNHSVKEVAYTGRHQTDGIGAIQSQPVRLISDTLIGHATPRGFEAIRDKFTGSWFIQHIVNVFMNHACELEIHDLFKMVDLQMQCQISEDNGVQTSCTEDLGFKKMYICPGLYDDEEDSATQQA